MNNPRYIQRDPALPALGDLFPPEGAPSFVAEAVSDLTGEPVAREAFSVSYVRYRPGKSCVVGWSWKNAKSVLSMASARIFYNDRADKLLGRSANTRVIDRAADLVGATEKPYRYFPQQRLLLQLFPLDLRLPDLVRATDPAWLAENLFVNGRRPTSRSVTATPVSYKPWRRCVYKYELIQDGQQQSFFAKIFRDDRGANFLEWIRAVNATLNEARAPWTLPTAAAYLPGARALIFYAIEDATKIRTMLRPALKNAELKAALLGHISAAAQGLAAFQRTRIDNLPRQTPQDLIDAFRKDCGVVRSVAPDLAERATSALDQLAAAAETLHAEALVPTHGAFRHDQLLHTDGRLVVLDLDTICLSGTSADAGNFLGYLDLTAIRRPRLQPIIDECSRSFVDGLGVANVTSPGWVAWYRDLALVKKALRAFFSLEPNWPDLADRLFTLAGKTTQGDQ